MGLRSQLWPNRGLQKKNVRISELFFDNPYGLHRKMYWKICFFDILIGEA